MKLRGLRLEMRCILFCDVVSSTLAGVHARQSGIDTAFGDCLARFAEIWRDVLRKHGAAYMKALGDGILATSPDTMGLVRAVVAGHAALASEPACAALCVRAGLHVGTVSVQSDGDILGADAALGARVMAQAAGGQVVVSDACAAQMRPYLPPGFALCDLGDRSLRGFDTPIRIYQLQAPGLADAAVPAAPEPAALGDPPIKVLLVEDERLVREALASLLALDPGLELVGTAADGLTAVAEAKAKRPDVVLMDIEMPRMNGIEATRRIQESCPDTEVCILTKYGDDERVFGAIRAGAIGYMLKDAGVEELGPVLRAVYRREGFLSPALAPRVMQEFARLSRERREARSLYTDLTRREVQVLELIGDGMRNRQIAGKLMISEATTRNHISNILAKLHVNDRTEAAFVARRHGLVGMA